MHLLPSVLVPTPVDDALAQSEIKTPLLDHLHPSDRLQKSPKHRNRTAPSLAGFSHTARDERKKAVVARRKSRWKHTQRLLSTYSEPDWSAFAMMPKALLIPCARLPCGCYLTAAGITSTCSILQRPPWLGRPGLPARRCDALVQRARPRGCCRLCGTGMQQERSLHGLPRATLCLSRVSQ